MSAIPSGPPVRRNTIRDIKAHKGAVPVVALTAYTAPMARLLDPHCDLFIVGDSLGMVLYGMDSTLPVTLEMMIAHGKAVVKASQKACVVVDMPFGSYQASPAAAFNASARVLRQTGCQAVKLEGGEAMGDTIAFLTARGVPVMGHIALTPQYVNVLGGYRYQGRNDAEREALLRDARAVEQAGAFAMVLEGVEESLAREITHVSSIPTIGIGASPGCDGQVLVTHDMLNLTPAQPKFVRQYGDVASVISSAAGQYAKDVRARQFPALAQCYVKKE